MNLRQRLLLPFSRTVAAAVAAVAWTVLVRIRHVFEERDQDETALFVSQFQREFQHRSQQVAADIARLAASERVGTIAFQLTQSGLALPAAASPSDGRAASQPAEGPLADRVLAFERAAVLAELERHHRQITQTAKALGLERSHLYKKCQQLGIDLSNIPPSLAK